MSREFCLRARAMSEVGRRCVDQVLVKAECPALPVKSFPVTQHCVELQLSLGTCCSSEQNESTTALTPLSTVENNGVVCMLCSVKFDGQDFSSRLAEHLLCEHRLVVADIEQVSCLSCYCDHWRRRFCTHAVDHYCYSILTNTAPLNHEPSQLYHLLSPKLPLDRQIREFLHEARLRRVLHQQQLERNVVGVDKGCLFCRQLHFNSFAAFFSHLNDTHNLSVGRPENIVFADEFIDRIEAKLRSLNCLYCDGEFKERAILKEHMRKKGHKTLNPSNAQFDRFYVVNYLEPGMTWLQLVKERDEDAGSSRRHHFSSSVVRRPIGGGVGRNAREEDTADTSDDQEWSEWRANSVQGAVCLFCAHCSADVRQLSEHMSTAHEFSLSDVCKVSSVCGGRVSFYDRVKLINYVRRQVMQCRCINCDCQLDSTAALLHHMKNEQHARLPERHVWAQSHYLLPTFDNDTLLHMMSDDDERQGVDGDDVEDGSDCVVAEDTPDVRHSILADHNVLHELKEGVNSR